MFRETLAIPQTRLTGKAKGHSDTASPATPAQLARGGIEGLR